MKTLLTFTLIIFSTLNGRSQSKEVYIPITEMHSTYGCYQEKKLLIEKHSQADLIRSTYPFHFRAWYYDRAIEIWEDSLGKVNGLVFFWVNEYNTGNTFSRAYPFDQETAKKLKDILLESNLNNIQTDGLINGWQFGNDGETYSFEYSTKTLYSFKTYWEPAAQDSVKESKKILNFVKQFLSLSNTNRFAKTFTDLVPFQMYTNDCLGVIQKNAFKKELE
ncbi:MAG: hypothetical protein EOO43_11420 [Flavobacterium sp.]|nr:MAG: hypothetical protein EOO43_11420 [Flavobacterium sp.]